MKLPDSYGEERSPESGLCAPLPALLHPLLHRENVFRDRVRSYCVSASEINRHRPRTAVYVFELPPSIPLLRRPANVVPMSPLLAKPTRFFVMWRLVVEKKTGRQRI